MFTEIDIETWNRRSTFEYFKNFEDPFFNMTANVDVTALYQYCKLESVSFSLACVYYSQSALNSIREFRLRILNEAVIEYDHVEATQTILNDDETFSFCYFKRQSDLKTFNAAGLTAREKYRDLKTFDVESDRIDLIYYSVIPWVSFTSFKHASRFDSRNTVPRIVFGKTFAEGAKLKMPISVEAHHALMDGIHVGKYYQGLQHLLDAV
jgi:chloramphenicol O-acetyltransferase type A